MVNYYCISMPVNEILIPNSLQKTYYHEPNQRFNSIDLNRVSGAFPQESMLMSILLTLRGMNGSFTASPQYQPLGFKISSYTTNQIIVNPGILIAQDGIYYFEGATLTPTPASHYGLYELEPSIEYTDDVMKNFLDIVPQTFFPQLGPSRKVFRLKLYENYNNTPVMPPVTPGRLELVNYKKTASLGTIVQASNVLGKAVGVTGFGPGDIKATITEPDGVNWLACDGSDVPPNYTDLIDVLRSCRVNTSTISIISITDNGGGVARLNFAPTNLKGVGLYTYPDKRHHCIEITSSSLPTTYPPGTYEVSAIDTINGAWMDIVFGYQFVSATGTFEIRPFSKADSRGGGARTPVLTYIKNHLPAGDPGDANRNLFTYQKSKNAIHSHGSVNLSITGSPSLTGSISSAGSIINDIILGLTVESNTPDPPSGFISKPESRNHSVPTGDFIHIYVKESWLSSSLDVNAGTLDVGGATDQAEGVISDTDNPNTARPDNFALYYQIKT